MKEGWEECNLEDYINLIDYRGRTPVKTETGVRLITAKNVKLGYLQIEPQEFINPNNYESWMTRGIPNYGDVIFTTEAPLANVAQINTYERLAFAQRIIVMQPQSSKIDSTFLKYMLLSNHLRNIILEKGTGATVQGIKSSLLKKIRISFPPLPEQQRIVSILDQAFATIAKAKENTEKNLQNAKELFESYLYNVFENKGAGWDEKILEDLVDEKCTLSYGIVQPGEEYPNGLPIIRPTDLTSKFISLNGLKRIDPKLADGYKRTKLSGYELLLCVRGSTGVVSIALKELEGANVTRGIVPIRFNPVIINQEFGYYLLISNFIQNQIRAKTYGAALMQINIGDLRKIHAPFPKLIEQQVIVAKLDALSIETKRLESIYQQKLNNLEELKKSLLQKAFSGELT